MKNDTPEKAAIRFAVQRDCQRWKKEADELCEALTREYPARLQNEGHDPDHDAWNASCHAELETRLWVYYSRSLPGLLADALDDYDFGPDANEILENL